MIQFAAIILFVLIALAYLFWIFGRMFSKKAHCASGCGHCPVADVKSD